jgi:hypothetical protein
MFPQCSNILKQGSSGCHTFLQFVKETENYNISATKGYFNNLFPNKVKVYNRIASFSNVVIY